MMGPLILSIVIYAISLYMVTSYLISLGYVKLLHTPFIAIPYGYPMTYVLSISLIALYALLTLTTLNYSRKLRSIESQISSYISYVAMYLSSSSSLHEALTLALRDIKGYFKDLLERMVLMIKLGMTVDEAIDNAFKNLEEYRYILRTISIAEKSGGKAIDVLHEASQILSSFTSFIEYRRRIFKQYFYLLVLVVIVYDISMVITLLIITSLTSLQSPITSGINAELIYTFMYYISIMISLVSGTSYGKCVEGRIMGSFMYVLTFLIINFLALSIVPFILRLKL